MSEGTTEEVAPGALEGARSATGSAPGAAARRAKRADWKLDDNDRFFVKISSGPAILGIHTFTDAAGKSLDEVADAALQRWEQNMRNVNVFTQVSRQRMTLPGDLPAIQIVHYIGRGMVGKSRKVIAVVKDRAFWIDAETHLASWPDYERDFNRIIESFRVQE